MPSNRTLIFAGGTLSANDLRMIEQNDYIIGADRGALFLIQNGIAPDLAVGDFDSVEPADVAVIESGSKRFISCDAVDKDLTDTELAFDYALERRPDDILLLGVTGTRIDHTLASIQMMTRALQRHVKCSVMDEHNYITVTGSQTEVKESGYTYVSLLPLTPEVTGITLEGFLYPLDNATLKLGQSLGISNRLTGSSGTVSIDSGLLLVIQSKD